MRKIECDAKHQFEVGESYPEKIDGTPICPYCLIQRLGKAGAENRALQTKLRSAEEDIKKKDEDFANLVEKFDILNDLIEGRVRPSKKTNTTDDASDTSGLPPSFSSLSTSLAEANEMLKKFKSM